MLWVVLILAFIAAAFFGGWHSLRLARQGALNEAQRALRRASLIAAVCGMILTVPTLGWPMKEVSVSVLEEVTTTVTETIQVPVQVTRWIFWKTTRMETKDVPVEKKETEIRTKKSWQFSFWLLFPMLGVGLLCYLMEKGIVRLLWFWIAWW